MRKESFGNLIHTGHIKWKTDIEKINYQSNERFFFKIDAEQGLGEKDKRKAKNLKAVENHDPPHFLKGHST